MFAVVTVPAVLRGCMVRVAGFAVPVMAAALYTSTGAFAAVAAAISDIFHTHIPGNYVNAYFMKREYLNPALGYAPHALKMYIDINVYAEKF